MRMSNRVDLTDRAVEGGWTLPEGWTVQADADEDNAVDTLEGDCYTPAQVAAWLADEWGYVFVSVWVQDATGREWGHAGLSLVEAGLFTMTDDDDNVIGTAWLDPLTDPGEYSPIREHDMIGEALRDAVAELERFGTPVITEPEGATVTGL